MTMSSEATFYGMYLGVCSSAADPSGANRIKAVVPQVLGATDAETDWAWPCFVPGWSSILSEIETIVRTLNSEFTHLNLPVPSYNVTPQPGQPVWISFEGGDVEHPIWHGVIK